MRFQKHLNFEDDLLNKVIDLRLIDESKREFIRNALLLKHVHQHEKEFQKQLNSGEKKSLFKKSSNTNMNDMSSERPECELFCCLLFN